MMAALRSCHLPSSLPRSNLPTALEVRMPHTVSPPTHILAVFTSASSRPSTAGDIAVLIPTHHTILAINCAHLPRLPLSRPQPRSTGTAALPVIPLTVPSAEAFAPLHSFLVVHRLDEFLYTLLSIIPSQTFAAVRAGSSNSAANPLAHLSPAQFATYLAASAKGDKMSALMGLTRNVMNVWRNACALGIFDRDLWAALDFAWEAILGAMNLVATSKA